MRTAIAKRTATEAERAHARYNLLTPAMIAARCQAEGLELAGKDKITAETVRSMIEDERPEFRLRAVDMRSAGATRPRWFLEWEWFVECLERRMNLPASHAA